MTVEDTPNTAETPAETPAETVAVLTGAALVDTLDKDGLAAYVAAEFPGRSLDLRRRIDVLREEVKQLLTGQTQKAEATEAAEAAKAEARAATTPVRARHKTMVNPATGEPWEWAWSPLFAKNADLEPVYED
jgi:hypothetical protein